MLKDNVCGGSGRSPLVSYQEQLNRHLSLYKRDVLGIEAEGIYKRDGQVRPHILPIEHSDTNLLPEAEAALSFLLANPGSRHVDFHHLNSSQAFALNLFFPYFSSGSLGPSVLLAALGQEETITKWQAEAISVAEEESNIDFVWDTKSGVRTFCEVKLSESAVASAIPNEKRLWKLRHLYREVLAGHLPPSRLEPCRVFCNLSIQPQRLAYAACSVSGMTIEPSKRLATDPVCGMEVDPASAATAEHKGTKFYFCCQGCAMKFRTEPDYFHSRQEAPLCKC